MEDVKLLEKILAFLSIDHGYGYGYGDGYGSGYGYGDGSGDGSGYGDGYGSGYGSGDGYGDGYGVFEINHQRIYMIDNTPTILTSVHGNIAKGFILQSDLTLTPCYVVKGNNLFAHGDNLRDAMNALTDKMFDDMPEDERIAEFVKAHPDKDKAYPNQDLFDWHHRLTGSCLAGRNAFVKDRELSLDGSTTVVEFIKLTKNAYNGSVIRHLAEAYGIDV